LIRRRAADRLHPRRDDAVLAAEEPVAHRLPVARGLRLRELELESRNFGLNSGCVGNCHRGDCISRRHGGHEEHEDKIGSPCPPRSSCLVIGRGWCVYARAAFGAAFVTGLTAALACFAKVANAAGLPIASSDRLLRSSVTPAAFRP